jgi:hypothetical protein
MTIRELLHTHIHVISETLLDHDAGIDTRNGLYLCPCGMRGTQPEWEAHVADKTADRIDGTTVQLPFEVAG